MTQTLEGPDKFRHRNDEPDETSTGVNAYRYAYRHRHFPPVAGTVIEARGIFAEKNENTTTAKESE
ncbi:hypothetical protein JOJ86_006032 [Rhodococcus percolatus]|uniref:hypothetical protein n=1 Tax=Rhodococcus opacus TaxID=37919 RepID=UPI0015FD382F|nr:hypothetical protein [Rhodococcus opacus]MBA8964754.1 hypothetical protein [Rhodococcus opacus]MBP2208306.1 hypothetical protein [Rhodococcus opacus]